MSNSLGPHGLYSPWNLPGQNIRVASLSLLQGSFQPRHRTQVFRIADSLPAEPQGKPKNTGVGSLSLLQQIFPTQESNWGLLHCRRILYQLSYQGSPFILITELLTAFFKMEVSPSFQPWEQFKRDVPVLPAFYKWGKESMGEMKWCGQDHTAEKEVELGYELRQLGSRCWPLKSHTQALPVSCLMSLLWEVLWLWEEGQQLCRTFNKFIIKIMGIWRAYGSYGELGWLFLGSI